VEEPEKYLSFERSDSECLGRAECAPPPQAVAFLPFGDRREMLTDGEFFGYLFSSLKKVTRTNAPPIEINSYNWKAGKRRRGASGPFSRRATE